METRKESSAVAQMVSVIVISYNNVHFLDESVKSVLAQSYENIELIISDDASVGCTLEDSARMFCRAARDLVFRRSHMQAGGTERSWKKHGSEDKQELQKRLEEQEEWEARNLGRYQTEALAITGTEFPNIRRLEFRRSQANLGTVKHLKTLKKDASGKYIMFLAADDKLHDTEVIRDMIDCFEGLPEDAYVLSSQCGMCDAELKTLNYYAVNEELKEIITRSTPRELFAELADWCIIPAAGTIYKKKVFEIYGDLDERYHLIEDWTYFLKLTRDGGKIYYYDRLTYMHRDGGISHGNNTGGGRAYRYYLEDSILLTRQEILPYLDTLTPNQRKRTLRRYRNTCREYARKYQFSEMSLTRKLMFGLKHSGHYIPKFLYEILIFLEWRAKWGVFAGSGMLALSFLLSLARPTPGGALLYYAFGITGTVLLILFMLSVIAFRLVKALKRN